MSLGWHLGDIHDHHHRDCRKVAIKFATNRNTGGESKGKRLCFAERRVQDKTRSWENPWTVRLEYGSEDVVCSHRNFTYYGL
jgi:hypothetical protein